MDVLTEIEPARAAVRQAQRQSRTVALVPTMGALHEGHLELIRQSKGKCDITAVTVFVNPTQFGPHEDLEGYPRTLDSDLAHCRTAGVDLVFAPSVETMYQPDSTTTVSVRGLTAGLCGPFRPGHFDGVATVVAKLFHILPADAAFFGEKDYQQLAVIRRMVRDLNIPIDIVGVPTVRAADGLALSSRNAYLTASQRRQATSISGALFRAADRVAAGQQIVSALVEDIRAQIHMAGPVEIEYVDVVDPATLERITHIDRQARICVAVRIGPCRLIDNVGVDPCR